MSIRFRGKRLVVLAILAALRAVFRRTQVGLLDVFFAYRVILQRNPDADGWTHYVAAFRRGELSLEGLANTLLSSDEFRRQRGTPGEQLDYATRPVEEVVASAHGCEIVVDANDLFIGRSVSEGTYEPANVAILQRLISPGDLVADVGANIGFFTVLAAKCAGTEGTVLSFEPIEHNYRLLEKTLARNHLSNVSLYPIALNDRAGELEFLQWERRNSGSFHILKESRSWDGARYKVQAQRFDDVFDGERLDFVKIDVEGAEGRVLDGMQRSLARFRPHVLFEYSPAAIADISDRPGPSVLESLSGLGYELYEAGSFVQGHRPMSARRLTKEVRRRGVNHLDVLAICASRTS